MERSTKAPIKKAVSGLLSGIAALALFLSAGGQPAAAQGSSDSVQPGDNTVSAQCLNAPQASSDYNANTGMVNFVGTTAGHPIHQLSALPASVSPEGAARAYLTGCGSLFGLANQSDQLALTQIKPASANRSVLKFQQVYQGIPVFAAVLVVQLDASKNVIMVNGDLSPASNIDTLASVDADAAQQTALSLVAKKDDTSAAELKASQPQLSIYDPAVIGDAGTPALVWRMDVRPAAIAPIDELVLVDAHSGGVLLNFNQVDDARNRLTYNLNGSTSGSGKLVCNESNPTCAGGDTSAVNAHVYAGATYDYYYNNFGRDSIDGAGMTLYSYVHYWSGYCNAFWDGYEMVYGDGCFIIADDVVGHELTHGVTQYESGLLYYNQSGAINESISDIFGEFVDQTDGLGNDDPSVKWLLGEDTSIGAIRNMQNPPAYSQPDRMKSPLYYKGSGDNGGVHTNSGVGNKAAYLITDGGAFNGYSVTGIGLYKTARIYYEAQTNIMTPTTTYAALANDLIQACRNLTSAGVTTADDCQQVISAVFATQMKVVIVKGPPKAGIWSNNLWVKFMVGANHRSVSNFAIHVYFPGCGIFWIVRGPAMPIAAKKFSFSGIFAGKGIFGSPTNAGGIAGLRRYIMCRRAYRGGPWTWSAYWRRALLPGLLDDNIPSGLVQPGSSGPGYFTAEVETP